MLLASLLLVAIAALTVRSSPRIHHDLLAFGPVSAAAAAAPL